MIAADRLYVLTAISNPRRFASRYKLYREFEKYVQASGATLITIEAGFGERGFPRHGRGQPQPHPGLQLA
jgi:hypothetical protein